MYTIIIPAYNEQDNLKALYARLHSVMDFLHEEDFEFLFVNDGSSDDTLAIIRELAFNDSRIKYISFARNFGKEVAMSAAIDYAEGDGVIFIDADLQDPPELIGEMIKWHKAGYDDVYARRRSRSGESYVKKITSWMYYRLLSHMSRVPIQVDTGDYRLLSRRVINSLRRLNERERNMKSLFSWIGFRKKAIFFDRDKRNAGTTKFNYFKLINLAIDGITSFTIAPLRIASVLGILVSFAAFCFLCYFWIKTMVHGNPIAGYPSLLCLILFLGGAQLLCLGIMGEYLGRVFMETKGRPLYLVEESNIDGLAENRPNISKKVLYREADRVVTCEDEESC